MPQSSNQAPHVITRDVIVHKANVALAKDESLSQYTQALNEAARAYIMGAARMDAKTDYCYTVEVYPASVVVSCSIYSGTKSRYTYYTVAYTRDISTGVFTFSDMTEVVQQITYRAKTLMAVTKGASGASVEVFDPSAGVHGWQPCAKSIFAGVV